MISKKLKDRDARWNSHKWSGWPGCYCLDCGIDDPQELAIALNLDWEIEECMGEWNE